MCRGWLWSIARSTSFARKNVSTYNRYGLLCSCHIYYYHARHSYRRSLSFRFCRLATYSGLYKVDILFQISCLTSSLLLSTNVVYPLLNQYIYGIFFFQPKHGWVVLPKSEYHGVHTKHILSCMRFTSLFRTRSVFFTLALFPCYRLKTDLLGVPSRPRGICRHLVGFISKHTSSRHLFATSHFICFFLIDKSNYSHPGLITPP